MSALHATVERFLDLPRPLADRIIDAPPIEVDGRTLDRHVQLLIAFGARLGVDRNDAVDVATRRREMRRFAGLGMRRRRDVHVWDRSFDGPGGELRARVYRPHGLVGTAPALVYLHGGGWVVGDLDTHDGTCRTLAATARAVVVAIDYRLAPEHPFPAAVDDAVAGYEWVRAQATALDLDPDRIGVAGDSAGGNLAAVVCLAARERGIAPPAMQALIYPATDAHFGTRSYHLFADGFFLDAVAMDYYRGCYLPDEATWDSPLASPLLEPDLSGLPPAVVVTCGFDPLRDEGDAYAQRLRDAGVAVEHRCLDDQVHGAFGMGVLPGGMARITDVCTAIGAVLHRPA